MNTLEIRNNAQMLAIVSHYSIGLVYSTQNMLEFALEFDGLLLEDMRHEKHCLYNYNPATASDTIRHPLWKV